MARQCSDGEAAKRRNAPKYLPAFTHSLLSFNEIVLFKMMKNIIINQLVTQGNDSLSGHLIQV
jgi:hypothetical protein